MRGLFWKKTEADRADAEQWRDTARTLRGRPLMNHLFGYPSDYGQVVPKRVKKPIPRTGSKWRAMRATTRMTKTEAKERAYPRRDLRHAKPHGRQ